MNRISLRRNYKLSSLIILVLFLIIVFTAFFFIWYNTKVTPKIVDVAEAKLNKFTESFLSMNIGYEILEKETKKKVLSGETKHCFTNRELRPINLKKYNFEIHNKFDVLINGSKGE